MIKRVIFDIDGTLITGVNFSPYISAALKLYGISDPGKTKKFISNIENYENTHRRYNRDLYLGFFSEKLEVKLNHDFLKILFMQLRYAVPKNCEKIRNVLFHLQKEYELVLLSNYFEESQRNRLATMGINHYFSEYHGENATKPNESSYKSSQGRHKPSECLIIGDNSKLDIAIPKSLGFKTLHVSETGDVKSVTEISSSLISKL